MLWNVTFICNKCHRSSSAVTPVKCECDTKNLTGTLILSKNLLTEKLTLVTPTSVLRFWEVRRLLLAIEYLWHVGPFLYMTQQWNMTLYMSRSFAMTETLPSHRWKLDLGMMTSLNGNIFRVTGHLCGEFTGPRWIPAQRPVTRSFDVFFICVWKNGWVNNPGAGDLIRYRTHYDVTVMVWSHFFIFRQKIWLKFLNCKTWIQPSFGPCHSNGDV